MIKCNSWTTCFQLNSSEKQSEITWFKLSVLFGKEKIKVAVILLIVPVETRFFITDQTLNCKWSGKSFESWEKQMQHIKCQRLEEKCDGNKKGIIEPTCSHPSWYVSLLCAKLTLILCLLFAWRLAQPWKQVPCESLTSL